MFQNHISGIFKHHKNDIQTIHWKFLNNSVIVSNYIDLNSINVIWFVSNKWIAWLNFCFGWFIQTNQFNQHIKWCNCQSGALSASRGLSAASLGRGLVGLTPSAQDVTAGPLLSSRFRRHRLSEVDEEYSDNFTIFGGWFFWRVRRGGMYPTPRSRE